MHAHTPSVARCRRRARRTLLLLQQQHASVQRQRARRVPSQRVSAHPASDVDDAVAVGVLGERLADDGLAAAKRAGDGARAWRQEHGGSSGRAQVRRAGVCCMRHARVQGARSTRSRRPAAPPGSSRRESAASWRASPPSTAGKSASSTRCPVSSGVSASSFCATGRGLRTGHRCIMLNLRFWPCRAAAAAASRRHSGRRWRRP